MPGITGGTMLDVDLSVISNDMLDGVYARLLVDFATAKDACDTGDMRAAHDALTEVIAEYSRRADAWITHMKEHA
jgi:hypothetical protein